VAVESSHIVFQRLESSADCVTDRTAPICSSILANSSDDLLNHHRVLSKCRDHLAKLNIGSGEELLHQLNSSESRELLSLDQLLEVFFHLSPDESLVLCTRLKLNTSSEMMTLPSVVNVFFQKSRSARFIDGYLTDESGEDDDEIFEDGVPLRRMQSSDPILSKNPSSVSAVVMPASKGGKAVQSLPECSVAEDSDVVGSFHVEIVPFTGNQQPKEPEELFGGAQYNDDRGGDSDDSSR
jgi:hypothetical protein